MSTEQEQGPFELLERLAEIRQTMASSQKASVKDRRLAAGFQAAGKEYARQEAGVLDQLVTSLRASARVIILVGGSSKQTERFLEVAKKQGAMALDASRAYEELCYDVAIKSGVATNTPGTRKLVPIVGQRRQQLTSDKVNWIQSLTRPYWTETVSYYGRAAALNATLCQPAPPAHNEIWYHDLAELIATVKVQFRLTNRTDEFGKVGILDGMRELCDQPRVHEDPIAIISRVDSHAEAVELARLFTNPPLLIEKWPEEVTKKFVTDSIQSTTNNN